MTNSKLEKISKAQLASGLIGMLCPVPVVGEAILSGFLYPTVRQTGIVGESKSTNAIASLCIAGLTRFKLYEPVYMLMLDYFSRILN